jgi:integrase
MPKSKSVPAYRLHKATGQARVIINGKHCYLGPFGSTQSKELYARLLAEQAVGSTAYLSPATAASTASALTVTEVCAAFWKFAEGYYQKNGRPSGYLATVRQGIRAIKTLYGSLPAQEFGPLKLEAVQQSLVAKGGSRNYVNGIIRVIRRMFKWATSKELLPVAVYGCLATLPGLKKGRTAAREPDPIGPVPDETVETTLPHLPEIVADMVRLQRYTGGRPEEICIMRPRDIDRSGAVWRYIPESHKTEHHGQSRIMLIGPKGQAILLPYLLRDANAYCFSPTEAEAARLAARREARRTKMTPSQANRRRLRKPRRTPGPRYTTASYRRAVHRACDVADDLARQQANEGCPGDELKVPTHHRIIPRWSPNRLRHSAATEIRAKFGLEAASTVLGHAKLGTTQIYAERDLAKAAAVMSEVG